MNGLLDDPWVNFGMGLLSASGPSRRPVGLGQAMLGGIQTMGAAEDRVAKRSDRETIKQMNALKMAQAQMEMAEMRRKQAEAEKIRALAGQSVVSPQSQAIGQFGPTQEGADAIAGLSTQFDQQGFINKLMNVDPLLALELKSKMVKERKLRDVAPGAVVIDEQTGKPVFTAPPDPNKMSRKDELEMMSKLRKDEREFAARLAAGNRSPNDADAAPSPTDETALDFAAQQYLLGDTQWSVGIGRSKNGAEFIRNVKNRAAQIAKENDMSPADVVANRQELATRLKAQKDFSTGQQGRAVNSFNTAIDHLETLEELGKGLENGNMQIINRAANTVAKWTGAPAPTSFESAKQIVGQEIVKAIVANGGGVSERQEAGRMIDSANSPAQLNGVIKTYKELMAGQLKSLKLQYEQTTKRKDFDEKVTPKARQELRGATSSISDLIPTDTTAGGVRKYNPATGRIE